VHRLSSIDLAGRAGGGRTVNQDPPAGDGGAGGGTVGGQAATDQLGVEAPPQARDRS